MDRRIVITGIGVVAANGLGKRAFWNALVEGRSGVGRVRAFDTEGHTTHLGAEADVTVGDDPHSDRAFALLRLAVDEAVRDLPAGIFEDPKERASTGVILGTTEGAMLSGAALNRRFLAPKDGGTADDRIRFHNYVLATGAQATADRLGLGGPRSIVSIACASGAMSVLYGADLIKKRKARRILAGGFESFTRSIFVGFESLQALTSDACRPFDTRRSGTVVGEGAGVLVLEEESAALERGARIYAEVAGGGLSCDAVHITAPDRTGGGMALAIRAAFRDSGVGASDVGYINAHGTGTVFNDGMECAAFKQIFGDAAPRIPISSIKPMLGHPMGAAGSLEAAAAVFSILGERAPATLNHEIPPPEYPWDFIPGSSRSIPGLSTVLSTNAAFGGKNTALLIRRSRSANVGIESI